MQSRQISDTRARPLRALIAAANSGSKIDTEGFYSIQAKEGVLLVEPINGSPFVFCDPNTVFVFDPEPGSGTDKLRQRSLAKIFFDQLPDGPQKHHNPRMRP